MTKVTDNIGIYDEEYIRRDGTIEIWFNILTKKYGHKCTVVRPFRVQKVLNENLHLN